MLFHACPYKVHAITIEQLKFEPLYMNVNLIRISTQIQLNRTQLKKNLHLQTYQTFEKCSLGYARHDGVFIMQRVQHFQRLLVVWATLHSERPLADCVHALIGIQDL